MNDCLPHGAITSKIQLEVNQLGPESNLPRMRRHSWLHGWFQTENGDKKAVLTSAARSHSKRSRCANSVDSHQFPLNKPHYTVRFPAHQGDRASQISNNTKRVWLERQRSNLTGDRRVFRLHLTGVVRASSGWEETFWQARAVFNACQVDCQSTELPFPPLRF